MARTKNSFTYTDKEKLSLMSIMRKYLPIGVKQWQKVVTEYNLAQAQPGGGGRLRDIDSLRTLWNKLSGLKKPTG